MFGKSGQLSRADSSSVGGNFEALRWRLGTAAFDGAKRRDSDSIPEAFALLSGLSRKERRSKSS